MKTLSAEEFDKKFDNGEDILPYIDLSSKMSKSEFEQKLLAIKKVNVDLPTWAIASLDKEAKRMGVTRQSIIKMWLIQKLDDIQLTRKNLQQMS
ncbi:MAG: CopG family transcriptional regulator [Campylobacterales bacterium]|nr:CopG family transcriptional regulator [Campylobacterales bacterium]